jgi:hypothetical protein
MGNVASQLKTNNGNVDEEKPRSTSLSFENLFPISEESGDEEHLFQ